MLHLRMRENVGSVGVFVRNHKDDLVDALGTLKRANFIEHFGTNCCNKRD